MADALDSIVKGAPMAQDIPHLNNLNRAINGTTPIASPNAPSTPTKGSHNGGASDPLIHTPSSPSMIYLNLLVLEASLRAQYVELRARRRHHTFFLVLLGLWTAGFGYALFLAPREDGSGVGGSVYWVVETSEKVCFLGGIMTGVLVWATGIWERGVRWPRRWLTVSNRGLRGFNCKVVLMKRPWWKEALGTLGWFLTYGLFSNATSSYRYVEPAILKEVDRELGLSAGHGHPTLPVVNTGHDMEKGGHEEDLSPGGDYVKLLLLAKPFSSTFRENWELYRSEYWEKENERRALLRAKLKERDRKLRKQTGGWFWWLPWRRTAVLKATATHHHHHHHHHGSSVSSEKALHPRAAAVSSEHRRTRSSSTRRGSMNGSVRSTTPTPSSRGEHGDEPGLTRKGSSSLTPEKVRRKKTLAPPGSATKTRPRVESRSVTPENPSPLAKESSMESLKSTTS